MKTRISKIVGQLVTLVMVFSLDFNVPAQTNVFGFTTALGNGSFNLNLTTLMFSDSTNNYATYTDPFDILTFNGTNYDGLTFTVLNNFKLASPLPMFDGFIIQAGSNGTTNLPDVSLVVVGNGSIIDGTSASDLFTVLSSFDNFYTSGGPYPYPHITFQYSLSSQPVSGNLITFQLVSTPEPDNLTLFGLGALATACWRHRCIPKKQIKTASL